MECQEVKNNLSAYLDQELDIKLCKQIESHLASCPGCFSESQQMSRAWDMLDLLPKIEPSGDYISRFWTKAAVEESNFERFVRGFKGLLGNWRFIPVATVLSLMLIIGSTGIIQQINLQNKLSQMKPDDIGMLQNLDLVEHFDEIQNFDAIKDSGDNSKESAT